MSDKCPKCDYKQLRTWDELSDEEKMAFKVQPTKYPMEQRKRHRFCTRCLFEEVVDERLV
jgi:hypothetical protein